MFRAACALWTLTFAAHAPAQGLVVAPELWDRPRSARAVLAEPALRHSVLAYLSRPAGRVVIRHGAAQESVFQASELRSWLIALAVESRRIELLPHLGRGEPLWVEFAP